MNNKMYEKEKITIENILSFVKIVYILSLIYYISTFNFERLQFGIFFWGISLIIFALNAIKGEYENVNRIFKNRKKLLKYFLYLMVTFTIIIVIYYLKEYYDLTYMRAGSPNQVDLTIGFFSVFFVVIAVFLFSGAPIVLITLIAIAYALFGNYLPGLFYFPGFSLARLINITSVELVRGVFGNLFQLGATLIAIFILFASLMMNLGAFDFVIKVSLSLSKISKKLITQVAVVSSLIMGMFSGSGAANVASTGSFTIPLMKKYNVPSEIAGAIEAVVSAGGQLMPPVMGTVAFLMAEYLGIPYFKIIVHGFLPALLFYIGVSISVLYISNTINIIEPSTTIGNSIYYKENKIYNNTKDILIDGIPLILGLLFLLYFLAIVKYEALLCGYYTILILIPVIFIKDTLVERKIDILSIKKFFLNIYKAIDESSNTIMQIVLILSCMDIVVVILSSTGLAMKLGMQMLSFGEQSIVYVLIISAILCIVLGCVVSSLAVYVLVVITVIPALLRFGIEPVIAHFYVFWFAMVGLITPPVAGNVVVAARIANSDFFRTGFRAMRIGISLILLPIAMINYPNLIIHDNQTIITFFIVAIAIVSFPFAFYGRYLIKGKLGIVLRFIILSISLGIIVFPKLMFINIVLSLSLILIQFFIFYLNNKKESYK